MKTIKIFLPVLLLLLGSKIVNAQGKADGFAIVGKPFADFSLNNIEHYKQEQISSSDFKGKWLVLDFWNRFCGVCLEKMPHLDTLRQQFSGKVTFFLVGYTGSMYSLRKKSDDREIRALYKRYAKEEKLNLAIAYDSLLFHRLDIGTCPFIVVIDPNGIVRAVTIALNKQQLQNIIDGKQQVLEPAYRREEYKQLVKQKKTE